MGKDEVCKCSLGADAGKLGLVGRIDLEISNVKTLQKFFSLIPGV